MIFLSINPLESSLPENWDGYGSRPVQSKAKEAAFKLLELLDQFDMPVPHFAPVSGGGLQLEWQQGKRELELEIFHQGEVAFLTVDDSGEMTEGTLPPNLLPDLARLVEWFKG